MQEEPWLRGTLADVPPVLRAVLHALEMAREDVAAACDGLSENEICASPYGLTPLSFHLRHIPASLDRLLTYAEGQQLAEAQKAALKSELATDVNLAATMAAFQQGLLSAEARIRTFEYALLDERRTVGRKALPTTVAGLLIHCAEHTSRHVGQVVTTARLLKAMRNSI